MDDKNTDILSKYGFDVIKTVRCRGALLIHTRQGLFLMREFSGSARHIEFEENLLRRIAEFQDIYVDNIVKSQTGDIINEDETGKKYIVRQWYETKDCDSKNQAHVIRAARALARLHLLMNEISYDREYLEKYFSLESIQNRLVLEFEKHNKELKRTRNYIRTKRQKNEFELMVLEKFDNFYETGENVQELARKMNIKNFISETVDAGRLEHGSYNYHNILFVEDMGKCLVTNFEKAKCSVQIRDLYDFMRKVMEKHSWDKKLGSSIIEEYTRIRPASEKELKYLALKLKYPEKYWKILNHYNNNNKAWVPDKDIAKLNQVMNQQVKRTEFIDSMGVL